jgi:hypothetical protein
MRQVKPLEDTMTTKPFIVELNQLIEATEAELARPDLTELQVGHFQGVQAALKVARFRYEEHLTRAHALFIDWHVDEVTSPIEAQQQADDLLARLKEV